MIKRRICFLISGILLLLAVRFLLFSGEEPPVEQFGKVSVKGNRLVDKNGNDFALTGVSVTCSKPDRQYINKKTFLELRNKWNINTIRICLVTDGENGYCSTDQKEELLQLVESGIKNATELGIYVIIDWHILMDGNPLEHVDEAVVFFRYISGKYGDQDNIIYEICNEPNGKYGSWRNIKKYAETIVPVIREQDKEGIIIVAPPQWAQDVEKIVEFPVDFCENIAYSFHFYAGSHKDDMRERLEKAVNSGIPIVVTEFGISCSDGHGPVNEQEGNRWLALLDKYHIGRVCFILGNGEKTSCAMLLNSSNKKWGWTKKDLTVEGKWFFDITKKKRIMSEEQYGVLYLQTNEYKNKGIDASVKKIKTWNEGENYYTYYELNVKNNAYTEISFWKAEVTVYSDFSLYNGWNAEYQKKKRKLIISPLDWNSTIPSKEEAKAGFILMGDEISYLTSFSLSIK